MLTIRLDPELRKLLDRVCKSSGMKRSEFARDALRRQLMIKSFERLREKLVPLARKQEIITDEDVFRIVS